MHTRKDAYDDDDELMRRVRDRLGEAGAMPGAPSATPNWGNVPNAPPDWGAPTLASNYAPPVWTPQGGPFDEYLKRGGVTGEGPESGGNWWREGLGTKNNRWLERFGRSDGGSMFKQGPGASSYGMGAPGASAFGLAGGAGGGDVGALEGFDLGKLNDPSHTSIKYQFARLARGYAPRPENLGAIVAALNAQGVPARQVGDDKIDFGDGFGPIDVIRAAGEGGKAWVWQPGGGGEAATSPAGGAIGFTDINPSFGGQNPMGIFGSTGGDSRLAALQAEIEKIINGGASPYLRGQVSAQMRK